MDEPRWGVIGFGEVGSALARHIAISSGRAVQVTDPILNQNPPPTHIRNRLGGFPIKIVPDVPSLVAGSDIVLSTVPPNVAGKVAEEAGKSLRGGLFIDLNSISPMEKQLAASLFSNQGYTDGSILGSFAGKGIATPIALAGPRSEEAHEWLGRLGFNTSVVGPEVGGASALKMCRSVFMKGLECLFVESLLVATQFGIAESVLETIEDTFSSYTFRPLARMLVTTHAIHAGRRSHEMHGVVDMLDELQMPHQMSSGAQDFLAATSRTGIAEHFDGAVPKDLDEVIRVLNHLYKEGVS